MTHYLEPVMRGEKRDCIAMTEPDAGSDLKGMKTRAVKRGDDWVINGTKHFISNAQISDFVILFAATGEEETDKGPRKRISCFLVDLDTLRCRGGSGLRSRRTPGLLQQHTAFRRCERVGNWQMIGAEGEGFRVVNDWLGPGRLTVAAVCQARAERAYEVALDYAAQRKQFGQPIGKFQGGFLSPRRHGHRRAAGRPAADEHRLESGPERRRRWRRIAPWPSCGAPRCSAGWPTRRFRPVVAWGVMADLPLERIWRDARVERIWEGTSEIQRHIISRQLLRPRGA